MVGFKLVRLLFCVCGKQKRHKKGRELKDYFRNVIEAFVGLAPETFKGFHVKMNWKKRGLS